MLSQQTSPTYYARLQFTDAESCVDWLESVPLADVNVAHEMISAQLELLACTELSALDRLRVLEVLYQPVMHVQSGLARRFTSRALPLSIVEYAVWNSVLELWQSLLAGYESCFRVCSSDSTCAPFASLIALRGIDIIGAQIHEHHRVYREVPAALWLQLNEFFAKVESQGIAATRVMDPLRGPAPARTPTAAYGQVLLAHLANPYTLSARQMAVMYRWAGLWGHLVELACSPPPPAVTGLMAIDLARALPLAPAREISPAPSVRYLGVEALAQALRRTLMRLRDGEAPASLGLGEDCPQPATERLLTLLYVQWCGAGMGQHDRSRERLDDARACVGLATVLRQLESQSQAFRASSSTIRAAFGPLTEQWNIFSISAPGFVGVTRGPECDERIRHHQLVAIKPRTGTGFQLAVTQWLKLADDGDLSIGLRLWSGAPQLIRLKVMDDDGDVTINAVALPAVPEHRLPETIVLEPGIFQPGLNVELIADDGRKARLTRLTERGADFERSAYELVR